MKSNVCRGSYDAGNGVFVAIVADVVAVVVVPGANAVVTFLFFCSCC